MSYVYAVLGSGRQGTAAAHDMARFGEAKRVLLIDLYLGAAEKSAARVNRLLGREDAAIKPIMNAHGHTPRGVHPAEVAVPPQPYVEELRRRGFALRESFHAR